MQRATTRHISGSLAIRLVRLLLGFTLLMPLGLSAWIAGAAAQQAVSPGLAMAWGANRNGALGDGTTAHRAVAAGVVTAGGTPLTGVVAIDSGESHSIALRADGTVWAWGWNFYGQLGDGTRVDRTSAVQVVGAGGVGFLTEVVAVSSGSTHNVAVRADGTVWSWGRNEYGSLGTNDRLPGGSAAPVQVVGPQGAGVLTDVRTVAAGGSYTLALKRDGTVWGWGIAIWGTLGTGRVEPPCTPANPNINPSTDACSPFPVQAVGPDGKGVLTDIVAIDADLHSLALRADGTVWAWGRSFSGQLGTDIPSKRNDFAPQQVHGPGHKGFLTDVTAIAVGSDHSLALKRDGTVWAWGSNLQGQLGDDGSHDLNSSGRDAPIQVRGVDGKGFLTGITAIAGGGFNGLALQGDGTVVAWGSSWFGQTGDGKAIPAKPFGDEGAEHPLPVRVLAAGGGPLGKVTAIAAGGSRSVAIVDAPPASSPTPTPAPSGPPPAGGELCFPGFTQYCVSGLFRAQWEGRGQLAINGYPLTAEIQETLPNEKGVPTVYTVQYFERVRMERHTDEKTGQPLVLLGQFGRALHPAEPRVPALPGAVYFDDTGHNVTRPEFAAFWALRGDLAQFGFPLGEEQDEVLPNAKNEPTSYRVQYFERARLEWHPENAPDQRVQLGQFGRAVCAERCGGPPLASPSPSPSPAGTVIFRDDFTNPDSGWGTSQDPQGRYSAGYLPGAYRIALVAARSYAIQTNRNIGAQTDVRIEADMQNVAAQQEPLFGFACRVGDPDNFYGAAINAQGYGLIFKYDKGKYTKLAEAANNPAIKRGKETNRVRLDCAGPQLTLNVNGAPAATARDGDFATGGLDLHLRNFVATRP